VRQGDIKTIHISYHDESHYGSITSISSPSSRKHKNNTSDASSPSSSSSEAKSNKAMGKAMLAMHRSFQDDSGLSKTTSDEQILMETTQCRDLAHIRELLSDTGGDVSAVMEILFAERSEGVVWNNQAVADEGRMYKHTHTHTHARENTNDAKADTSIETMKERSSSSSNTSLASNTRSINNKKKSNSQRKMQKRLEKQEKENAKRNKNNTVKRSGGKTKTRPVTLDEEEEFRKALDLGECFI
jgi:hypothetical protein